MGTSIFLSNNTIHVIVGDKGKRAKITQSYRYQMNEGNLLNGLITNEDGLIDELKHVWATCKLDRRNVSLVINGQGFGVRKVQMPTLDEKKLKTMIPLAYEGEQGDHYVYDYMTYSDNEKGALKNLLVARASKEVIERWVDVFERIDVKLEAITISNATTLKYLGAIEELEEGSSLVLGIDDNLVNSYLWVNGNQEYTGSKRLFNTPGTIEWGIEITRRIDEIQQFYRSLKCDTPLKTIYTYAFDTEMTQALKMALNEAGIHMSVSKLPGNIDDIELAGNLINRKIDIDLLEQYKVQIKKENKKPSPLKVVIGPILIGLLCAVILGALFFFKMSLDKQYKELEDFITDPVNLEKSNLALDLNAQVTQVKGLITDADNVGNMIASYPHMDSTIVNRIYAETFNGIEAFVSGYSADTGIVTIRVYAPLVDTCNQYVTALKQTGLFDDVNYVGYTFYPNTGLYQFELLGTLKGVGTDGTN
ncbi:MAG: hypothetical protein HUJ56_05720 [Erysipelotrichaceae bacterium]|nr:hypothetical protein [Erysipelotrichaceae bacterium]